MSKASQAIKSYVKTNGTLCEINKHAKAIKDDVKKCHLHDYDIYIIVEATIVDRWMDNFIYLFFNKGIT